MLSNPNISAPISPGFASLAVMGFAICSMRRPTRRSGASGTTGAHGMLRATLLERAAPPLRAWKAGLIVPGIVLAVTGTPLAAACLFDRLAFRCALRLSSS